MHLRYRFLFYFSALLAKNEFDKFVTAPNKVLPGKHGRLLWLQAQGNHAVSTVFQ